MARVRSPNFPILSLPQAVERIERIYKVEQTVPADQHTIAQHLGYSGLNGASLKMISALRKYGLLEETGQDALRVSALALTIMHPASESEKREALQEAANGPALYRKLNEIYEGKRPSETNLRSWLLRNGFSTSAVDNVIKAYGETMDLVGEYSGSYNVPVTLPDRTPGRELTQAGRTERPEPRTREINEPFSVELLRNRFRVVGELTSREDAEKLISILSAAMAFLPERPEAEDPNSFADPDSENVNLDFDL